MANNVKNLQNALKWLERRIREEVKLDGCTSVDHAAELEFIQNMLEKFPLRQCDVGTAEEQSARFIAWRYSNPLRAELGWDALEWAQKPYEQEGDEEHGKA